jgi:hypothetical protein
MNQTPSRRRQAGIAALLAALLLRALVPAGFMPAVAAGSLALVFCEPGVLGAGAHAHRHHPGPDGAGSGGHCASTECPFAQSAAPVLPSVVPLLHAPPRLARLAPLRREDQVQRSAPARHAAARGPPAFC